MKCFNLNFYHFISADNYLFSKRCIFITNFRIVINYDKCHQYYGNTFYHQQYSPLIKLIQVCRKKKLFNNLQPIIIHKTEKLNFQFVQPLNH